MNSSVRNIRPSAFYTVREAAWFLGVHPSTVCRAIRTGELSTVRRRSRLVVPAHALVRVLVESASTSPPISADRNSGGDAR